MEKVSFLVDDTRQLSTIEKHVALRSVQCQRIPQSPQWLSTSHTNVVSRELQSTGEVMHFSPKVMSVKELMNEKNQ